MKGPVLISSESAKSFWYDLFRSAIVFTLIDSWVTNTSWVLVSTHSEVIEVTIKIIGHWIKYEN